MNIGNLILLGGMAAGCTAAARTLLHFFQLESYQFPGWYRTLKRRFSAAAVPGLVMTAVCFAAALAARLVSGGEAVRWWAAVPGAAVTAVCGIIQWKRGENRKARKPLVVTRRVKRLLAAEAIVYFLLGLLFASLLPVIGPCGVPLLLPVWFALAALLAWPVEKGISELYFRDAQRRLKARPDLIRIGVTGSYGKTSVKFILGTLLSEKYQVLVTPSSFNTPMGVTSVIRSRLLPSHQVFVAEMGARHVGDIREMCRLVHPVYGVLTSVGMQHLDTFRSLDNIAKTKYELMDAIPADGCCFFPDDGGICRALWEKTEKPKHLAAVSFSPDADVWAEDVRVSASGSSFALCTKSGRVACETILLGEHSIQNIVLAASVCLALGMNLQMIRRGIAQLKPVAHRLQLLPSSGGITVIDDAFNSSPNGAMAALRVLASFAGRRIIITPGMVELGTGEAEYNRAFGEQIAGSADIAILVGRKHTAPIAEGLRSAGFPESAVHVTASLDEAAALLRTVSRPGDTVLFENDLPDNYSEEQ